MLPDFRCFDSAKSGKAASHPELFPASPFQCSPVFPEANDCD